MTDKERIDKLEKRLEELEKLNKKEKKEKVPRKPSAYNNFMKKQLAKEKKDNPEATHKECWKKATAAWNESPENTKNKDKEEN